MARQSKDVTIRRYEAQDEQDLFGLLEREGDEWKEYWCGPARKKYKRAMRNSVVYLLFEGKELCGYARCRDDDGYGVYVYDLLVDKAHRGKEYGRLLMERACRDFPGAPAYVLGDVYPYYEKLGYAVEGSIYTIKPK